MVHLPDGVTMQDYLFNIDVHHLLNKIERFRKLNFRRLSNKEIQDEFFEVLMFDNRSVLSSYIRTIPVGTPLFRIRKLENSNFPNSEVKTIKDVWEAPSRFVKRGRLNKPHESLLYTCFDVETAIFETRIAENDPFALIVYDVIDDIKTAIIGSDDDFSSYQNDERLKLRIISSFLRDEFTRDVGGGNEYLYKVSEIIAKAFFDYPPRDVQDAWCYPSVVNKPAWNICFRPDIAREKLKVHKIFIVNGYQMEGELINLQITGENRIAQEKMHNV